MARAEANTYGLPTGEPIRKALVGVFARQRAEVLAQIGGKKAADGVPIEWAPFTLGALKISEQMTPLLSTYWDESGSNLYARLGLDPDAWEVTNPHTEEMIQSASLAFCASTNATTSLKLDDALEKLRAALVAGVVTHGESVPKLTARVNEIFDTASSSRARMIAQTEAARAVHAAQEAAAKQTNMVAGWEWLASSDACPICLGIMEHARFVRMNESFAVVGKSEAYSKVRHPPAHPHCNCSMLEVLKSEYSGEPEPAWSTKPYRPGEDPDPKPVEPTTLPGIPKPPPAPVKPPPAPVQHPDVPDRVPKPDGRPDPPPMPENTPADPKPPKPKPAPKPKPPKPKPKPVKPKPPAEWPDSLEDLEVIQTLGGSTGAQLVRDRITGKKFVRKQGNNPGHLLEEMAADDAYRAAGARVPDSKLYRTSSGAPVKLSKYIEGGRTLGDLYNSDVAAAGRAIAQLRKHFAVDALLGNWDVIGANSDNILIDPDGNAYRIDNGGSLRYRAQGALKSSSQWTGTVGELDSLRHSTMNSSAVKVFGGLTDEEVRAQCKALGTAARRKKILAALPEELRATVGERFDSLKAYATPPKPSKAFKPRAIKGWSPEPVASFKTFTRDERDDMNRWGNAAYKDWADGLTKKEVKALAYYTGSGYTDMNDTTRKDGYHASVETQAKVATLTKALNRVTLTEPIAVYRGIKRLNDMGIGVKDLGYGDVIKSRGFASCSTNVAKGETFAGGGSDRGMFKILAPKGTRGAYVNASAEGSSIPGETEFLLPPGKFQCRVVKVEQVENVQYGGMMPLITVELIP